MELTDLRFDYPPELIATEKQVPSRILLTRLSQAQGAQITELKSKVELCSLFQKGDVLVVNNTKVLSRRLFSDTQFEILFLNQMPEPGLWQILCPSSQWPKNKLMNFPESVTAELVERGRIQTVRVHPAEKLSEEYFLKYGDPPLPPYILKARKERRARLQDKLDYQTKWAKIPGSLAAPTASLHFSKETFDELKGIGVQILEMTLHVGLGTFLPITTRLEEHKMHSEHVRISQDVWTAIEQVKASGKRVWALGTTVTRALESVALGKITKDSHQHFSGETDIFIQPGFDFKIVDALMTNFHQPESTLLALVAAFAGLDNVKATYDFAIQNKFRLFSYGDLSVWIK